MAGLPAIPETAAAKAARISVLHKIVKLWPTAEKFAIAMGVSKGTVSRWLSGELTFGWAVIYSAIEAASDLHPAGVAAVFAVLAKEVGAPVEVTSTVERQDESGTWPEELLHEAEVDCEILRAVAGGDEEALAEAVARGHRELDQQHEAGKREIAGRAGTLRAVGGGR